MYMLIKSSCCILKMYTVLFVSYSSINLKKHFWKLKIWNFHMVLFNIFISLIRLSIFSYVSTYLWLNIKAFYEGSFKIFWVIICTWYGLSGFLIQNVIFLVHSMTWIWTESQTFGELYCVTDSIIVDFFWHCSRGEEWYHLFTTAQEWKSRFFTYFHL